MSYHNCFAPAVRVCVCQDFNPEKYEHLAGILGQAYLSAGSPVPIVAHYLSVFTRGQVTNPPAACQPFSVKSYDARRAYVACSFKGELSNVCVCVCVSQCVCVCVCVVVKHVMFVCRGGTTVWCREHSDLQRPAAQEEGGGIRSHPRLPPQDMQV